MPSEIEEVIERRKALEAAGLREPHVRIADVFRPLVYAAIWVVIVVASVGSFLLMATVASAIGY